MATAKALHRLILDIEAVLDDFPFAEPNKIALERLRALTSRIAKVLPSAATDAHRLFELATLFYSERRHARVPGGAAALYAEMREEALVRLRTLSTRH